MLDYQYFKDHYQLIAVNLSKQKDLDTDPRAFQQIAFYGMLGIKSRVCTISEKAKETILQFKKEQQKFCEYYKRLNTIIRFSIK